MGKGIKTRVSEKKGIKAIDKAAVASERMKEHISALRIRPTTACMPRRVPPVSMRPTAFPLGWIMSPMKRSIS